jgi:hypothetical protein
MAAESIIRSILAEIDREAAPKPAPSLSLETLAALPDKEFAETYATRGREIERLLGGE